MNKNKNKLIDIEKKLMFGKEEEVGKWEFKKSMMLSMCVKYLINA